MKTLVASYVRINGKEKKSRVPEYVLKAKKMNEQRSKSPEVVMAESLAKSVFRFGGRK